jgi:hypothetical protein
VALPDPEVSRRHAILRPVAGGVEVEDLGSTNGTFVDGKRIAHRTLLANGSSIRLGTTVIGVVGIEPVADPQATRLAQPVASPQATRLRQAPGATRRPAPSAVSTAGGTAPRVPLTSFSPPAHKRRRGLASRSWLPVALSFGTVVLTAIALVIFFATR